MTGTTANPVGKHLRREGLTALALHGMTRQTLLGAVGLSQAKRPRHSLRTWLMQHLVGPRMRIVVHPDREGERLHLAVAVLRPSMARHGAARGDTEARCRGLRPHSRVDGCVAGHAGNAGHPGKGDVGRTDHARGRQWFRSGARSPDPREERGSARPHSGSKRSHVRQFPGSQRPLYEDSTGDRPPMQKSCDSPPDRDIQPFPHQKLGCRGECRFPERRKHLALQRNGSSEDRLQRAAKAVFCLCFCPERPS